MIAPFPGLINCEVVSLLNLRTFVANPFCHEGQTTKQHDGKISEP